MTIGEDRNKVPFKHWRLCALWKLPFRHHGAIKLTQNFVCFTNQCINTFVPTSVTPEYHPKVLERLHLLRCMSTHLQNTLPWASWETQYLNVLVLIFVPAWSHATENRSNAFWRPCWEDLRMQYQFIRKKQTVHPAVPNSDTFVDAPVTVYPVHIDQVTPNFLGEDPISYCTTVRGPDILRNVIFSGYVTLYQINTFFVNILFFHYWQNMFCGRVKSLRRFDLVRGA